MQAVSSPSQSFGGSRGKPGGAKAIVQLLVAEQYALLSYARLREKKYCEVDDATVLSKILGIINPFSKQADLIRSELGAASIEGGTAGTVHSLQGDERLAVLFSSVYGKNNKDSGKYSGAGPNMLNVAVSRAKDLFIVFGDPNVLGVITAGSPSGLLSQRLVLLEDA